MTAGATFGQAAPLARTVADIDILALAQARIPGLRKVARTGGGELHGPCSVCGGTDRFVVNGTGGKDGRGLYWCRNESCTARGDAVSLLQLLDGGGPAEAFRTLGIGSTTLPNGRWTPPALPSAPQEPVEPPPALWRSRALALHRKAESLLWSEAGNKARSYLHSRGLTDDTIRAGRLGLIPADTYDDRAKWGLDLHDTAGRPLTRLRLSRGILIPYWFEEELWRLEVRRPVTPADFEVRDRGALPWAQQDATGKVWRALCAVPYARVSQLADTLNLDEYVVAEVVQWLLEQKLVQSPAKYVTVAGSANAVWGLQSIDPARPGVLVEGVINALTIQQEAGDLVNVAALGATTHGRRPRWVAPLMRWAGQLIALDSDLDAGKGDAAAAWWLDVLQPTALRWRPLANDPNAMLLAGHDVRGWVAAGVTELAQRDQPAPTGEEARARSCPACGAVLTGIAELCPHCAQPAPQWRGWGGEEGGDIHGVREEDRRREAEVAAAEAEAAAPAAPSGLDGWWERFEALLQAAGEELTTAWYAYQDAYNARQPVADLAREVKDIGGGPLLSAWLQYRACLALGKAQTNT